MCFYLVDEDTESLTNKLLPKRNKAKLVNTIDSLQTDANSNGALVLVERMGAYYVLLEKNIIQCINFKEGLQILLQCAFVFNVHYAKHQAPVCAILERNWLDKKGLTPISRMADAVLKKINNL